MLKTGRDDPNGNCFDCRVELHPGRTICSQYLRNWYYAMLVGSTWHLEVMTRLAIQAYLGHKNIQHTVRYTDLCPGRFKNFGSD